MDLPGFAKEAWVILGVVVAFIAIERLLEKVVPMLLKRNHKHKEEAIPPACNVPADVDLRLMQHRLAELHTWHDQRDEDGVKIWYLRQSFYRMMEGLKDTEDKIAGSLRELVTMNKELCRRTQAIEDKLDVVVRDRPNG